MSNTDQQQHSPADVVAKEDALDIYTVPTKGLSDEEEPAPKKIIDTKHLSEDDIKTLKKKDPFLYYSILRSGRRGSIDSMSPTQQDGARTAQPRRRISCPYRINSTPTSRVEKRTCISFECHPDMFFHEEEVDHSDTEEDDANEDFNSLFEDLSKHQRS